MQPRHYSCIHTSHLKQCQGTFLGTGPWWSLLSCWSNQTVLAQDQCKAVQRWPNMYLQDLHVTSALPKQAHQPAGFPKEQMCVRCNIHASTLHLCFKSSVFPDTPNSARFSTKLWPHSHFLRSSGRVRGKEALLPGGSWFHTQEEGPFLYLLVAVLQRHRTQISRMAHEGTLIYVD